MLAYEDPNNEGNSPKYLSGKLCIEKDCGKPAGTAWSPYWCFGCNVERMKRIDRGLKLAMAQLEIKSIRPTGGACGQ